MKYELLKWLRCPSCHSSGLELEVFETDRDDSAIKDGVLLCQKCRVWYKVEDRVAEIVSRKHPSFDDKNGFLKRYREELKRLELHVTQEGGESVIDRQKEEQARFFNESVDAYQTMIDSPFWRAVDKTVLGCWRHELQPRSIILDIGCGDGRGSLPMAREDITVIGVDISKGMVRKAIDCAEKEGRGNPLFYFVADAENLPFRNDAFDVCIGYGMLHHLPQPGNALREISRVLKPSGRFYGLENNRSIFRNVFDRLMKMKKLWEEEAGEHFIMSSTEIRAWCDRASMSIETQTIVYLPPHVFNFLGRTGAVIALKVTNAICGILPYLRDQGGLLVIRGKRRDSVGE